jgi:multiple sugar transport system permease protein
MREEAQARILAVTGAVLLAVFCLGPVAYMILVALASQADFLSPGIAFQATLANFREALDPVLHVPAYMLNTFIVAAATSLLAPAAAGLAAYPIARLPLRGRSVLLLSALALSMFPPISLAGSLFRMVAALHWTNSYPALIVPYAAWLLPLCLWFLAGYLSGLPRELDRAALVDGCTRFGILRKVLLPLSWPGLASSALIAFIFACNEFLFALLLTVDERSRTLPVGIALFQGLHGETPWGSLMAVAALSASPVVLLALFFQRHVVQGLTRGAVKG